MALSIRIFFQAFAQRLSVSFVPVNFSPQYFCQESFYRGCCFRKHFCWRRWEENFVVRFFVPTPSPLALPQRAAQDSRHEVPGGFFPWCRAEWRLQELP